MAFNRAIKGHLLSSKIGFEMEKKRKEKRRKGKKGKDNESKGE